MGTLAGTATDRGIPHFRFPLAFLAGQGSDANGGDIGCTPCVYLGPTGLGGLKAPKSSAFKLRSPVGAGANEAGTRHAYDLLSGLNSSNSNMRAFF